MTIPNLLSDGYERKARLYPALIVLVPVLMCVLATTSASLSGLQALGVTTAGCGGAFLLAQLARGAGKRGEPALYASWGGMPSIALLHHRDDRIDPVTKARYHKKLGTLVKGTKAPTPAAEAADEAMAERTYTAWSTYLRVHTRDSKKYPFVFQENVNYGYRRNLWGLRPIGIACSAVSLSVAIATGYVRFQQNGAVAESIIGAAGVSVTLLLLWVFQFTKNWVRLPAEAYAHRLIETIDGLGTRTSAAKSTGS